MVERIEIGLRTHQRARVIETQREPCTVGLSPSENKRGEGSAAIGDFPDARDFEVRTLNRGVNLSQPKIIVGRLTLPDWRRLHLLVGTDGGLYRTANQKGISCETPLCFPTEDDTASLAHQHSNGHGRRVVDPPLVSI